jgi:hypothetical protein
MLKLKNTPGLARSNLVMTSSKQEQISQYCDPHGICAPFFGAADLMLAQPEPRFELPIDDLSGKGLAR